MVELLAVVAIIAIPAALLTPAARHAPVARHLGFFNALFLDSHVEAAVLQTHHNPAHFIRNPDDLSP